MSNRSHHAILMGLALSLQVACNAQTHLRAPAPTGKATPAGRSTPVAIQGSVAASPSPTRAQGTVATASPDAPTPSAAASIAAITLSGRVSVLAALVSNNGGGIITDNGSGLISDGGSGVVSNNGGNLTASRTYHALATPSEVPYAHARVALFDATGKPLAGPDGLPLVATADATGNYAFDAKLPADNFLVEVELAGGKGRLQGLATRGTHEVNLDLVSTLTTAYITSQYVNTQANPQTVLDKLPADVEATTRQKAAAALSANDVTLPATLEDSAVVATVDALRQKSTDLDDQMTLVKNLLIAAGQSNLGEGQPLANVSLGDVRDLAVGPDGLLYITTFGDGRIWHVDTKGNIQTVVGSGSPAQGSLEGQDPLHAGLDGPIATTFDAQGRLVILENSRVAMDVPAGSAPNYRLERLEKSGVLHDLWPGMPSALGIGTQPNGDLWVLTCYSYFATWANLIQVPAAQLWSIDAAGNRHLLHTYGGAGQTLPSDAPADTRKLSVTRSAGIDAAGNMVVATEDATDPNVAPIALRIDAHDDSLTTVASLTGTGSFGGTHFCADAQGDVFAMPAQNTLSVTHAGQNTAQTLTWTHPTAAIWDPSSEGLVAVASAPGGQLYFATPGALYELANGQVTLLSGHEPGSGNSSPPPPATASTIPLTQPAGVAMAADGTLFFVDADNVLARDVAGKVTTLASLDFNTGTPWALRCDAAKDVFVSVNPFGSGSGIVKLGSGGQPTSVFRETDTQKVVADFVVAPDGTLYISQFDYTYDGMTRPHRGSSILALAPGATAPTTIVDGLYGSKDTLAALCVDAAGTLYYASDGKLSSWTRAAGSQVIGTSPHFAIPFDNSVLGPSGAAARLAMDAAGRFYVTEDAANVVTRFDPGTGAFITEAGTGGTHFNGTGVDDGLKSPCCPCIAPNGDLYFSDTGHKEVKRIAASDL